MPPAEITRTIGNTSGFATGKPLTLAVLSNDLSGGNRKDPDAVYRQVRDLPNVIYYRVRSPEEISAALKETADHGTDILAINGGDGTIQATFSAIFNDHVFATPPPLALLLAGTTSMTAGDVGLRGKRSKAVQRLLKWIHNPETPPDVQQRSTVRVRGPAVSRDQYGMFFGTGAIYQAIAYCRERVHTLGLKGEIGPGIALARFIVAIARRDRRYVNPVSLEIGVNGNHYAARDYLLVMASTLKRLFLGIRPFWGQEAEELQLTAMTANPRHAVRSFFSLLRGKQAPWMSESNGYISRNVAELTLNLDSGFTLDGELFVPDAKTGPTIISNGGQLTFIRV